LALGQAGESHRLLALRLDRDLLDRLVLRGVVGRQLGLGRAECLQVGACSPEAVVVREGRAVAPGEAVGGRSGGGGDCGVAVAFVDLDRGEDVARRAYVGNGFAVARRGADRTRTRQPYAASPPISNNVRSDDS